MDNEIIIILTDKEAYYLAQAVAWKRGTRQLFGVTELGDKIYDQLAKAISAQRMATINEEWSEAKEKSPTQGDLPPQPKQPKPEKNPRCLIHNTIGNCLLCRAKPRKKPINFLSRETLKENLHKRAEKFGEKNKVFEESLKNKVHEINL